MAIDDHLPFPIQFVQPLGKLVHGQVDSARDATELPFLQLANIHEQWHFRLLQPLGQFSRPELTYVLPDALIHRMHAPRFTFHFRLLAVSSTRHKDSSSISLIAILVD